MNYGPYTGSMNLLEEMPSGAAIQFVSPIV